MYIVHFRPAICEGCGKCTHNCPAGMLGTVEVERHNQNKARKVAAALGSMWDCMGCGSCVAVCERGAVTVMEI